MYAVQREESGAIRNLGKTFAVFSTSRLGMSGETEKVVQKQTCGCYWLIVSYYCGEIEAKKVP